MTAVIQFALRVENRCREGGSYVRCSVRVEAPQNQGLPKKGEGFSYGIVRKRPSLPDLGVWLDLPGFRGHGVVLKTD